MRLVRLFLRFTCAKIAFVAGLGVAPAVAASPELSAPLLPSAVASVPESGRSDPSAPAQSIVWLHGSIAELFLRRL